MKPAQLIALLQRLPADVDVTIGGRKRQSPVAGVTTEGRIVHERTINSVGAGLQGELLAEPEAPWIEWPGGEMPVPLGTLVDIRTHRGDECRGLMAAHRVFLTNGYAPSAGREYWRHTAPPHPLQIVAYRISK